MIVIKAELFDFIDSKESDKGAKKFNTIWAMSNREAYTVFKRCQYVGLVSFDVNNGWLWKKATPLGTSEPMAIEYVTKNPSMLMTMDNESKSMDDKFGALATDEEKEKFIVPGPVNKNVDNNILKEQNDMLDRMKQKEKELDDLISRAKATTATDIESKIDSGADSSEEAKALKELQDKARKLHGMKNAYMVKDPVKIQEWIDKNPAAPNQEGNN